MRSDELPEKPDRLKKTNTENFLFKYLLLVTKLMLHLRRFAISSLQNGPNNHTSRYREKRPGSLQDTLYSDTSTSP